MICVQKSKIFEGHKMHFENSIKCAKVIILLTAFLKISNAQRKIKDGAKTQDIKRYMVYLLKAKESPRNYDEWLCGGAIVSQKMIVTSAACVTDVEYMYAIAGYDKYVRFEDINKNQCTKEMKKKVIKSCVPEAYDFSFEAAEKWSQIDIAVVEVETPYDFNAPKLECCTHAPNKIVMNFDSKYQMSRTDVFMLGWGHKSTWREPSNTADLNSEVLNYGSTIILDKEICKSAYSKVNPELVPIIDKYMICTLVRGNLNDQGKFMGNAAKGDKSGCLRTEGTIDEYLNCISRRANVTPSNNPIPYHNLTHGPMRSKKLSNSSKEAIQESLVSQTEWNQRTESMKDKNAQAISFAEILGMIQSDSDHTLQRNKTARRQGLCQNDHGGPLITWRGTEEILIGVASVFQVSTNNECIGPYLFTSTHCNSLFLDCVVNGGRNVMRTGSNGVYEYVVGTGPDATYNEDLVDQIFDVRRQGLDATGMAPACNRQPAEMGFRFSFRRVNWDKSNTRSDTPPAEPTGEIKMRPQIPISVYAGNVTG